MEGDRFILGTDRLLVFRGYVMGISLSIVGVYHDGRHTTLCVNVDEEDAKCIAEAMRELDYFARIDLVAEEPGHTPNLPRVDYMRLRYGDGTGLSAPA